MRRYLIPIVCGAIALAACGDNSQVETTKVTSASSQFDAGNLAMRREGCLGCHTVTGGKSSGPTLKGLAGSQVQLENGETVTADDSYLRRSILYPNADIVKGFHKDVMQTTMSHRKKLTDKQIDDIIAYLDSLK